MATEHSSPISSHPAFRWAVGAWFAALLGGGLFVMPDSVHAAIRAAIGLEGIVPGGIAGKAGVSAAAALFGLLLGLALAMRVSALNAAIADDDPDETQLLISESDEADFDAAPTEEFAEFDTVWLADESEPETPAPLLEEEDQPRRPFNPREYLAEGAIEAETDDDEAGHLPEIRAESDPMSDHTAGGAFDADLGTEASDYAVETGDAENAIPASSPPMPIRTEALGDLSLGELTDRLAQALQANIALAAAAPAAQDDDADPVIAFLRREADRATTRGDDEAEQTDPQSALRSALDRLSQVGKAQ
ncbi:hypothetical protein [Qipengyuania zhejiangensis]|uniref:hypothetical protein n=1 Tax=Qipengyuania zhejiangensis TaxID=3077782 RepID=UPI002D79F1AA|nr:hypothetical protein [Qipengyuania sp. Z2]